MDITNYPLLQEELINTIPKHVYGNLQKFNIPSLPSADRLGLVVAYRDDVEEEILEGLINANLSNIEVAEHYKNNVSIDSLIDNIVQEAIYDIAQEMGPTLREIERNNHVADRTDER